MAPLVEGQPVQILAGRDPLQEHMLLNVCGNQNQFSDDLLHVLIVLLSTLLLHLVKHLVPVVGQNIYSALLALHFIHHLLLHVLNLCI